MAVATKIDISIRELSEKDISCYRFELIKMFNYLHSANQNLDSWFLYLKACGKLFGAFDDDNRLVGMLTLIMIPKPYGFALQIEDLAVMEDARGLGVGFKLVQHVDNRNRNGQWGYKTQLLCSQANLAFYKKLGFHIHDYNMRKDS